MKSKNRARSTTVAMVLAGGVALGTYAGGTALDQWLSPYRDVDLLAPAGIEEVLPPDPLREERTARVIAKGYMLVSSHPAASQAGAEVMNKGGNALDAVFAAQAVLNLVEPQASGFGGGGALLYWDENAGELFSYDGRGMAPLAVDRRIFLNENGSERFLKEVMHSGGTILVPGLMALLGHAHQTHGSITLSEIFSAATKLADTGFPISPRLEAKLLGREILNGNGIHAGPFAPLIGKEILSGAILANPDYAGFLRIIANCGAGAFYSGTTGEKLVADINQAPGIPGSMSPHDLAVYRPVERKPICIPYRSYRICGAGPPVSGSLTVLQIMGLLESHPLDQENADSLEAIQLISEAARLAIADRDLYLGDPGFVDVPSSGMVNAAYLKERVKKFSLGAGPKTPAVSGYPPGASTVKYGVQQSLPPGAAAQIVARDRMGNMALLSSGLESDFGAGQWSHGFPLNNALLGFSKKNAEDGIPVRNRIEPWKRPVASWAPIIVFDSEDNPVLALGAAGDDHAAIYVARTLVAVLDWGLTLQNAISLPQFNYSHDSIQLEVKTPITGMAVRLRHRGYHVRLRIMESGLHGISLIKERGLEGGVDPRGEGMAIGDRNILPTLENAFDFVIPQKPADETIEGT